MCFHDDLQYASCGVGSMGLPTVVDFTVDAVETVIQQEQATITS